jgi:ElaA protein
MERIVKHFSELTTLELMEIYSLRMAIFVVEQNCPYQDIDGWDPYAYHVYLKDEEGIRAYLRVLPQNSRYAEASLGRVVSNKRRCGLATRVLQEGIAVAREKFGAKRLILGAQTYARPLYEKVGFVSLEDEYLEDGQPHVHMILELE